MPEWLEISFRTIGLFLLLLFISPFLGRKPFSGMTYFDHVLGLVAAIMIALTALRVVEEFAYGLLALFLWTVMFLGIQFLVQKWKWAHDHIYGKELVVIKNGKILEENLQSARLTAEELLSQLRRKNIFHVADVEFAVLEANGDLSALLKKEKQPLTPKDMDKQVSPAKEPHTVIMDGQIMDEGLTAHGLNRAWLMKELDKLGISLENVFLAQVDSLGQLYVDTFDDTLIIPEPKEKELLLASLKQVEADFITYALETENKEWKQHYGAMATEISKIIKRLEPHLNT